MKKPTVAGAAGAAAAATVTVSSAAGDPPRGRPEGHHRAGEGERRVARGPALHADRAVVAVAGDDEQRHALHLGELEVQLAARAGIDDGAGGGDGLGLDHAAAAGARGAGRAGADAPRDGGHGALPLGRAKAYRAATASAAADKTSGVPADVARRDANDAEETLRPSPRPNQTGCEAPSLNCLRAGRARRRGA
jgi:hypothetical protein